jgi:sterol desaturase/sphingolipid hydroxylase (fatty acid hydroxylase superfamily)
MPEEKNSSSVIGNAYQEYWDALWSSLSEPSLYKPLSYLLVVYLITFSLELILPKKMLYSPVSRKGFKTDLIYVFFIDFFLMTAGLYALTSLIEFFFLKMTSSFGLRFPIVNLDALHSPFLRFLLFFLIIDFVQWFAHFLLHRVNFLWQFHKIHHAQETLGFASTRHFHWGEYLILKPMLWIPFGLLGFQAAEYFLYYLWCGYFLTFFSHCNIKINFGFLNYIFITPQTHYWHHARNIPKRFGVNYASSLVIWDLMFGFFYNPRDKKPILGIPDNDVPDSFLGQMIYPFKSMRVKSQPAQNKDAEVEMKMTRQEKRKQK